jgi:hypothetical protein
MMSRSSFERLLEIHVERAEIGAFAKAKKAAGPAWRPIVDRLYLRHRSELRDAISLPVLDECARSVLALLQSVK